MEGKLQEEFIKSDSADVVEFLKQKVETQEKEIERLKAFYEYFSELYGQGLEVANWHQNGELEPFDDFFESAEQEME